jgi:hypothetical protein
MDAEQIRRAQEFLGRVPESLSPQFYGAAGMTLALQLANLLEFKGVLSRAEIAFVFDETARSLAESKSPELQAGIDLLKGMAELRRG